MDFGNKIIEIRQILGLSQKSFAQKLGIAQNTLSNYESEKRTPTLIFIQKLINIGISPLYLFHGKGKPFNPDYDKLVESYLIERSLDIISQKAKDKPTKQEDIEKEVKYLIRLLKRFLK